VFPHHQASITNVVTYFERQPGVLAVLLGGSIAHGFETAASDIDVMIVVPDEDHAARSASGELHFFSRELCTYPEGYVDGKYLSLSFLDQVANRGSEPARFAFQDARVLFSRIPDLADRVCRIARYPLEDKIERLKRFYAQFEAWHWYTGEGLRLGDRYLLGVAVDKLVLFAGRMVLAHNEALYPYHKWFRRVLAAAEDKPEGLLAAIDAVTAAPTVEHIEALYALVKTYRAWEQDEVGWPVRFMDDSELNWLDGHTPVDDL
jgi:hypothetical protein